MILLNSEHIKSAPKPFRRCQFLSTNSNKPHKWLILDTEQSVHVLHEYVYIGLISTFISICIAI